MSMPTVGSSTIRMLDAGGEPFGDADLLLVAAGEIADRLGERGRAHFELANERRNARALPSGR